MNFKMKETLILSLKTGGRILLEFFNKPLKATQKESQSSIVTEADLASDQAIKSLITERFPEHNLLSEETGFKDNGSEYTWIIDPLDGTSNFASGIPWFGVLVTLFHGNNPLMAGAYLPAENKIYFAEKGKGAFRNDETLRLTDKPLRDSLFAFCVDYTDDTAFLNRGMDIYKHIVKGSRNIRTTNCLIDFVYVAEGKFGGVLNLCTRIWDIAGLGLIINEAGGLMKVADGTDLNFFIDVNTAEVNFPVIAGNKQIVRTLENEILRNSLGTNHNL